MADDAPQMKNFSLTTPDGQKISGRAPGNYTEENIIEEYIQTHKQQAQPPAGAGATALDAAESFGTGIEKGVIGMAGLPGDAARLVGRGVDKVGQALGARPRTEEELKAAEPSIMPTSKTITGAVEGQMGPMHKPQTTAGKYSEAIGEAVPAVATGPGRALTKAATAVGSGIGSEAGGEYAPRFGVNSEWGRFAGGLLGGVVGGVGATEAQLKRWSSELHDRPAIKEAGGKSFEAIQNARLQFKPQYGDQLVTDIKKQLDAEFYDATSAPRTFNALDKLEKAAGDVSAVMSIEQNLNSIRPSAGSDYAAALKTRAAIFDFIDQMPPEAVLSGDPKFTLDMWKHGKANWRAHKKLELVEDAEELGTLRAKSTGTGANEVNALRQKFLSIINSAGKSRGYSQEAKDKMLEIIEGNFLTNMTRKFGKLAPTGVVSGLIPFGMALEGHGALAIGTAIFGQMNHEFSKYLTRRQIRELADIIRLEAPINKPVASQLGSRPSNVGVMPTAAVAGEISAEAQ